MPSPAGGADFPLGSFVAGVSDDEGDTSEVAACLRRRNIDDPVTPAASDSGRSREAIDSLADDEDEELRGFSPAAVLLPAAAEKIVLIY